MGTKTEHGLEQYVTELTQAELTALPREELYEDLLKRITTEGQIAEISEDSFEGFAASEVHAPMYVNGALFALAFVAEPLKLFWKEGCQHFCRQLSWDETHEFCGLAGISLEELAY